MVAAYVVVDIERTDLKRAARCSEMSGPIVERHGSGFVNRGGPIGILEGDREPQRLVVIEFRSAQPARHWPMVVVDGV